MRWDRVESAARTVSLTGGLEARIADPLWMLARQWQLWEFKGDDAGQPIAVRASARVVGLGAIAAADGDRVRPLPSGRPLEAVVEAAAGPDFGAAGLFAAARAGRRLSRVLEEAGLGAGADALRGAFTLELPDRLVALGAHGAAAASVIARFGLDGRAVAAATTSQVNDVLGAGLSAADVDRASAIVDDWREWYLDRDGDTDSPAWDAERLEYRFAAFAGAPKDGSRDGDKGDRNGSDTPLVLSAPEHDGGHLDWYSFDVAQGASVNGAPRALATLPTPVRYSGMPASRWWELEDADVNFGDLDAGPSDLPRLMLANFATEYGRDWFVFPLALPVGTLTEVETLEVIDTFGDRHPIRSTALLDTTTGGGGHDRPWRFCELTGDRVSDTHPSPWLLVAPTLVADVNGPALEQVELARDEGANLGWAIERSVEGPLGQAVERAAAWYAANAPAPAEPAAGAGSTKARTYTSQAWRYRLEGPAPPWWMPLLPEPIADSAQVRLRRGRMSAWDLLRDGPPAAQVGPQGTFLDPRAPARFDDQEVQRAGVTLERRWQIGRWHDGSLHVWLQRRKHTGRGERSSGMRWDLLQSTDDAPPPPTGSG